MSLRSGGMGLIEEGSLRGRKFIIPSEVFVERGEGTFQKACLIHGKFIPDGGCPECAKELEEQELKNAEIGL